MSIQLNIKYTTRFNAKITKNNFMNILYINIRSLRSKLFDLTNFVESCKIQIDCIVLTETWLYEHDKATFNIPDFECFHSTRHDGYGGVSVFVHRKFSPIEKIEEFEKDKNNNVIIGLEKYSFKIIGIYRRPQSNLENFLEELERLMDKYSNNYIIGDLNLDLLQKTNSNIIYYLHMINSNGYKLLNKINRNMATRIQNDTRTCIDHIFTHNIFRGNILNDLSFIFSTFNYPKSDHKANLLRINKKHYLKPNTQSNIIFNKINYENIIHNNTLNNISEENFDSFINELQNTITLNTKTINIKERFKKDFMDTKIINLMTIRNNFLNLKIKYPRNAYVFNMYKKYRNLVTRKIRENKTKSYDEIFKKL